MKIMTNRKYNKNVADATTAGVNTGLVGGCVLAVATNIVIVTTVSVGGHVIDVVRKHKELKALED